ncbi:MAG: hypothetical protein OXG82_12905 [Gammaproteobacteria bacterium]|nr:hypothetical protein [Gammaproteobacteria bacterium]
MNDKLIASDAPFTPEEQAILDALADTIVPASEDGVMPSAGELDVAGYVAQNATDFLTELGEIIEGFGAEFAGETLVVRVDQVKAFSEARPEAFQRLLAEVYGCYYQDARVLEGIGVGAGPPFPRGNTVEPGDLSLLDPVMANPTKWRRDVPE